MLSITFLKRWLIHLLFWGALVGMLISQSQVYGQTTDVQSSPNETCIISAH